jgi:hypothetical protein
MTNHLFLVIGVMIFFIIILSIMIALNFSFKKSAHIKENQVVEEKEEEVKYRLGDVLAFNGRLMREFNGMHTPDKPARFDLGNRTIAKFPNSIATAFLLEARKRNFTDGCFVSLKKCTDILVDVADNFCPPLLAKQEVNPEDAIIIHVRAADVITVDGVHGSPITGRNLEFYRELAPLLRKRGVTSVILISNLIFKKDTFQHDGPPKFVADVQKLFEDAGVQTKLIVDNDADTDFCLMANAKLLVPSRSGLSESAAEVVLAKGNKVVAFWRGKDDITKKLGVYDPDLHKRYEMMHPKE